MRGDDFRQAEQALGEAGVGLADRQRHERHELIAERAEVEALAGLAMKSAGSACGAVAGSVTALLISRVIEGRGPS